MVHLLQQQLPAVDQPLVYYDKQEYIETDTGNKVNRRSMICGSQNIVVGGKTIIEKDCILRGDLRRATVTTQQAVVIALGRYCHVGQASVLKPPFKTYKGVFSYYPMKIADHVVIGHACVIEAASIGSHVRIGKECIIGRFVIIKDGCLILDHTVIPPNTVIPSFSIVGGNPGRVLGELPECTLEYFETLSKEYYHSKFIPNN